MPFQTRFRSLIGIAAVVLSLAAGLGLWAGTVTPAQADQVAQNFVSYVVARDGSWGGSQTPAVARVEPVYRDATLIAFRASVSPSGFVLVPAEDELPAVKAFSTTGDFDQRSGLFWDYVGGELAEIVTELRRNRSVAAAFGPQNRELWERFDVSSSRFEIGPMAEHSESVSPILLKSKWDQGDPYNQLCPLDGGARCPVGCVATATAQVMRYWNYPTAGQGSHSYNWRGQALSADFGDTAYDWANMPDQLTIRSTQAQKAAVSTLGYEVAVAFEMDFAADGSGAYTVDAERVLPQYFRYSTDIKVKGYTGSDATWFPYFKSQVDNGRPVLLSIRGTSGGHAVVVDGYSTDSGNMVHINMGWGGSYDGYYALNNITPGPYSFKETNSQNVIYDIHPPGQITPPSVSAISKAGNPFRFVVNGSSFSSGIQIFIGTDTAPWPQAQYKSDSKIVIKGGSTLKAKVPKGIPTAFRFVNPDGGEATYTFTW